MVLLRIVLFFCLVATLFPLSHATSVAVVDIANFGFENLERFKSNLQTLHDCEWWIEVGDRLLALSNYPSPIMIQRNDQPIFIVSKVHISELQGLSTDQILLHSFGFAIIQAPKDTILATLQRADTSKARKIVPFDNKSVSLVKQVENTPQVKDISLEVPTDDVVPISTLINLVSQARWFADVTTLATYNRYTKGPGIASAQKWITDQLALLTNLTVTTQAFTSGTTSGVNVIATLKGTSQPNNLVIVGGHYDSTSQSPTTAAPGAEDDGSGAAAVLEMARIFNSNPPPGTAIFIFFSGEEQGLLGSAAYAQGLVNAGNATKVKLMHNMDMIAYQQTPTAQNQVILETTTKYASLFPYYRESGARYTQLGLFESTTAWGSDHESFITRNMPGLLTIDKDWDVYPYYHRTTDTIDKLNPTLGYEIIKLGVGAVAQVLGYPF